MYHEKNFEILTRTSAAKTQNANEFTKSAW